jgi:hypothetical protein
MPEDVAGAVGAVELYVLVVLPPLLPISSIQETVSDFEKIGFGAVKRNAGRFPAGRNLAPAWGFEWLDEPDRKRSE